MKYIFLILIVLSTVGQCYSQTNKEYDRRIGVYTMPLSMVDPTTPRLRLGIEKYTDENWFYSLDVGIGTYAINGFMLEDTDFNDSYFFLEFRPELNYAFTQGNTYMFYGGMELFYLINTNRYKRDYYYNENDVRIDYEVANFTKVKIGLQAKFGFKVIVFEILQADFYGGGGVAYRDISYSDVIQSNQQQDFIDTYIWFSDSHVYEGTSIIPHLTMGVNIGLILKD